jgi:hypothetical protein
MRLGTVSGRTFGVGLACLALSCGAPSETSDPVVEQSAPLLGLGLPIEVPLPLPGVPDLGHCLFAKAKDTLIAELVKDSWRVGYPLTRLYVNEDGSVSGPNLPPLLQGELDVINTVEPARASVAAAVAEISGLPDYVMNGMSAALPSCLSVPAWTPNGTTSVATTFNEVFPGTTNIASWRATHAAFAAECPLVRSLLNTDAVDPPGDGSTNNPPSSSVSASGVRANSYGLCGGDAWEGRHCKLSYASGVNWTGRRCQTYYGYLRCLLY